MRAWILLTFFAAPALGREPCGPGGLGRPTSEVPCDGDDIDIAGACHCNVPRDEQRPWGATEDLVLEMPRTARAASGQWTGIPFALTYRGEAEVKLDFPGGKVVRMEQIRKGNKEVPGAACGELALLPDPVRLTLRKGTRVRGTIDWRASTSQLHGCSDFATDLAPGRYAVTFETVSGSPPLRARVEVTVTRR